MEFIETKMKNGASLYMMPMNSLKSVVCGALIRVGSRDELLEKNFGIAHALEHMPFKGTKNFPNPLSLSSYIEEVGGFKNASTSKDRTFFWNKLPDYELERSVNWLYEILEKPLLRESDLVAEKKVIFEEINKSNDNPDSYFWRLSYKNLFGNHPMAHSVLGTEESIQNLSVVDLINFHKKFYGVNNYVFFVVGNIDCDKVVNIFNQHFQYTNNVEHSLISNEFSRPIQKEFINIKDFKQMKIRLSFFIQPPSLEDKIALYFLSDMLSSGMASPLFQEFRVKRNLVYSINSSYNVGIDQGLFSISMSTSFKDYNEIRKIVLDIIEKTKQNKNRFNHTKQRAIGSLSFAFESPFNTVIKASKDMVYLGKPMGYEEARRRIEAISLDKIKLLIDKYFNEDNLYLNVLMPKE
ncbi:insulinase family protein [Patescibacteria group bacterium]|nr:insulinase family protein [Patescibacteria group bacterium]